NPHSFRLGRQNSGHNVDAGLGKPVGEIPGTHLGQRTHSARQIYDSAVATTLHDRDRQTRHQQRPVDIRLHGVADDLDLLDGVRVVVLDHDARVVDENVEAAELLSHPVHALANAANIGDIELSRFDGEPAGDQWSGGCDTLGRIA